MSEAKIPARAQRERFVVSELGLLPRDWRICELGSACSLIVDCPHTTPTFRDEGILVARTTNIRDGRFVLKGASYVDQQEFNVRIVRAEPKAGDLIFTREAPVGEAFVVPPGMRICLGQRVMLLRPDPSVLDSTYLHSQICSGFVKSRIATLTAGTTNPHLNVGEVRSFLLPVPPIAEQRRIAEILATVDEAIWSIERLIAKLEQTKRGLLRDLLTLGVDDSGHLRDRQNYPEQFSLTQAGSRPCDWRISTIHQIVVNCDDRRIPLKQEDRATRRGNFPYYGASGIIDYIDDYLFDGSYILLGEDGENVVSRNLPLAFTAKGRFWVNNHAHVFEPRAGNNIEFLTALLESMDFSRLVNVSAQPKLTQSALNSLLFAVPSLEEQNRISDIIATSFRQLEVYRQELAKLRLFKQGLTEDLLTGRVRAEAAA